MNKSSVKFKEESQDSVAKVLKEAFNIDLNVILEAVTIDTIKKSSSLAEQSGGIAPKGNYVNMLSDNNDISKFLTEEASKPEHWKLVDINKEKYNDLELLVLKFANLAVDDGENLYSTVFVNSTGNIKHILTQVVA